MTAYTEIATADVTPDAVAERIGLLAEAGADVVVLQSDEERPDPVALRRSTALRG